MPEINPSSERERFPSTDRGGHYHGGVCEVGYDMGFTDRWHVQCGKASPAHPLNPLAVDFSLIP